MYAEPSAPTACRDYSGSLARDLPQTERRIAPHDRRASGHGELAPPTAGFSRQQRVPRALARVGDLRLAEPSPRHDPMRPSGDEALLRAGPAIRERRGRRSCGDPSLADRRARPCASDRRLLRRRHPGHGFEAAARPAGVAVAPLSHQRLQPALSASAGSRDRPAGYFCRKRWRKEQRGWTSLCRCSEQARPAPGAPCQNGWRSKKATWSDGVSERRRQAIE
mmetsp:Transcript_38082/g.122447  ORF Transcript_38082/g.122447 Transcript_38082/m.122447 type:complete len:222 (-) Transcript_38082:205-870(-)